VISAPDHVAEREAIRKGWGDTATKMAKVAISTVYVLFIQILHEILSRLWWFSFGRFDFNKA
jgi:hypothetical protein